MNEQTTDSGKKKPAAFPALMPAIFTFGATPTMPMPFEAAAIVPAVCVRTERVSIGGRAIRQVAVRRTSRVGLLVRQLRREAGGRRRVLDPAVLQQVVAERR